MVILDETQKIKNRDVEVSRKCKQLYRRPAGLTGTPLENKVDDLASIMEFVAPLKEGGYPLRLSPVVSVFVKDIKNCNFAVRRLMCFPIFPPKLSAKLCFRS